MINFKAYWWISQIMSVNLDPHKHMTAERSSYIAKNRDNI